MSEPEMQAWRSGVRDWLHSMLPPRPEQPEGPADYAVFQNITEKAERDLLDKVRAYRKQRYDAGYGAIALPSELGGAGLSMRYVVAFTEEEQAFDPPQSTELISVTCGLVGPTIATFGTRRAAGQVRPRVPALGPAVLPAVQRAGRGLRPGRGGDQRGVCPRTMAG